MYPISRPHIMKKKKMIWSIRSQDTDATEQKQPKNTGFVHIVSVSISRSMHSEN
jgi:hypothetical protein